MTHQLIHETTALRRGLVADSHAKHYKAMKQAVWLFLYLLLAVNRTTGKRLLSPAFIAAQMGVGEQTIRSWLGHLRSAAYIGYQKQGGYLHITVKKWRRTNVSPFRSPAESSVEKQKAPPGLGPEELARALGGSPDDLYWGQVVSEIDPEIVQKVLDQVTKVPTDRIKKSRVALFRYLINKRLKS